MKGGTGGIRSSPRCCSSYRELVIFAPGRALLRQKQESRLLKTLQSKVSSQKLFKPGETVVVAVSGGVDSVALLDILAHLQAERLDLIVAHLNHCLRGDDSDQDEEFVSRLAAGYRIPFISRRADVTALAKASRLSLEDAGRKARYAFFAEIAQAHGATSIALAHHLDDQAETVLIRLLRGAGGGGLSAMSPVSAGMLKRPLLQISRSELEQYLKLRGLTHRVDATNADTAILRNSIRHELIPLLRKYNPKVSERLAATAEILACDEELLAQMTEETFSRLSRRDHEGTIALCTGPVLKEPRGLRLRLYRHALSQVRGDLQRIALSHLDAIDRLAASDRPNARVKLPGECLVVRCYGDLTFHCGAGCKPRAWEIGIEGEGNYPLPTGGTLDVQRIPRPAALDAGSRHIAFLDPQAAPFPWTVRTFQPGDRFRPLGMQGGQKVKDFFMNEKVPPEERRSIPLVISDGRIVWIAGLRLANDARVGSAAADVLRVEVHNP